MNDDKPTFSLLVQVDEVSAAGRTYNVATTLEQRERVARQLGLPAIEELTARLTVTPFRKEGLAVEGVVVSRLVQTCVVSAENFETTVEAPVEIRFSPDGRDPNAEFDLSELTDPEAEDPPDLMTGGQIDLGAVIVEFLALALDPYPRKPGVEFANFSEMPPESPFAALKPLKENDE